MNSSGGFPPSATMVGKSIDAIEFSVTHPIHHVVTTAEISTLNPPPSGSRGFIGPVWLIASSVFKWTTGGNIAGVVGSTIIAGSAYGFIYDPVGKKWYPVATRY